MIKLMNGLIPTWFTLPGDESKETQFLLKPLTSAERLDVLGINNKELLGQSILMVVKYGVQDWKGIKDEAMNDVLFSPSSLSKLPADVLATLSTQIMTISSLTSEQVKN